jgi:uncharacterized protein (TIGR03437 family)
MKATQLLTLAVCFGALNSLPAAPSIAALGVKNSASYANPGFQNGAIAQGSLFVVFGSGMGPSQIQYATSFPLPATLAGTSANVTVNGSTLPCVMIYTQDGQIAAILPSSTPVGTGTLTVTYNGSTSPTAPVTVAANSPGLFTRNQQGNGPAVVQDVNGNYNSFTNSFRPGQTVTFWGTGFGPISGEDAAPPPTGNLPGANVTAMIGGQTATVTYAGRSSYAGVDQINVTIPSGVSGCFVSVGLFVNGVASNFTSIAVSNTGNVCSDPNLFTSTDIQNVANGNPMRLGTALLSQFNVTGTLLGLPLKVDYETGKSYYQTYTPANFLNSLTQLSDLAVSPGSCGVFQFSNGQFIDPVPATGLNAGAAINVSGGGTTMQMTNSVTGHYQGTFVTPNPLSPPPPFLKSGGTYAVDNGSGGADIGAFKFNATLPPTITWTNKPSASTISRSQNLSITWSGGDPSSFVYVLGQSPIDTADETGAEFVCVAQNAAGGMTIPAAILSALPVSSNISEFGVTIPGGLLVVNATTITRATATGLDVFLVGTTTGDGKGAFTFQ